MGDPPGVPGEILHPHDRHRDEFLAWSCETQEVEIATSAGRQTVKLGIQQPVSHLQTFQQGVVYMGGDAKRLINARGVGARSMR